MKGTIYKLTKLNKAVDFLDSKRIPVKSSDRKAGPYPYYGANGQQGTIDGFIFDEPLILLAEDGGHFFERNRGIAYKISGKTWVNNHAHVLRPKPNADIDYLCLVLKHLDVSEHLTGTTRAKLTKAGACRIEIPLPPIDEQKRIAGILVAADALRAKRRESLAQLDTLLQSTFLDMFGDPVTNPKGWDENEKLGELSEIVSGITKGRKLNGQIVREIPYLAVSNVQDRHLVLDSVKVIQATEDEIKKFKLLKNDLLLTEGGDPDKLGRGSLWNNEIGECIHQNHIFRVRLKSDKLHPVFLNWIIGSKRGKAYFLKSAKQTTGIASINMTQLRAFPLLMPPVSIQNRFATIVESIEKQKSRLRAHLAELDTLFASLQSRAFNGEL